MDTPQTKSPLSPDFAKQFASNGNANIVVGEEVKEYLLMRSIVDDQLQRAVRLPAAASSSSECSFSFKVPFLFQGTKWFWITIFLIYLFRETP